MERSGKILEETDLAERNMTRVMLLKATVEVLRREHLDTLADAVAWAHAMLELAEE